MGLYEEFNYLSTKNKYRYSAIMNIFLYESERINLEITEDYIYEKMLKTGIIEEEEYTKQQLINDLRFLEENNNIFVQEENLQNIRTLEEYKNRKRYYSITRKGAFVARNIRQYLLLAHKTSLCDEHFERLIKDIRQCKKEDDYGSWNMFFEDAGTVFQIYQDFLAEFNERKFDKIVSTKEFISYKKEFLEQINMLIDKLSKYAGIISKEMENISCGDERLYQIRKWFLYVDEEEPTYINILHYCSILIEKITRKAKLLVSSGEESKDYKNILHRFVECKDLKECEKLSLEIFGYQEMKHMNYHGPFKVKEVELKEKKEAEAEIYDEEQKIKDEQKALKYLDREMKREQKILKQSEGNKLKFEELKGMNTEETLTVLTWLSKAMENKNKCSETESGKKYRIERQDQKTNISFETKNGNLMMPDFEFVFEDENNE